MPFLRSAAQTFNKAAALWRRYGAVPLSVGLAIPDIYYAQDKQAATLANIASVATTYAVRKTPSFWIGFGAPIAAYGTVRGSFYLGKRDAEHNTVQGFQEKGVAGKKRKAYGFGSGWRGIPASLMGQEIDPRIREFREDVMDVRSARRALYSRIHQAEEASLARMGSLSGPDFMRANLARMRGINTQREGLHVVNLDRFKVEVDDADTLVLKRGGLAGFFGNEIQVRLAGIDAPEVAGHSGDPLEEIRFWQAQPGGQEATERLRNIIGTGEGFQLVVGPEKTYGRYIGAVIGPSGENVNIQLAREGMVAALPFGPEETDVVSRQAVARAQAQAQADDMGIWGMARYKAIAAAQEAIGQPITYNTMTRLDKLSQNLNLGAYASFLQDMGTERRALTPEEENLAQRMGYSLKKTHGRRFNKAVNPIKGHDSNHWGRDWVTSAIGSDFLPGASWVRAAIKAGASLESIVEAGTRMGAGVVKGELRVAAAASGRGVAEIAQSLKGASADEILATIQKEFRVTTSEGAKFVRGRALEEGSFKQATLVHGTGPTGRKAVLTEQLPGAGPAPDWERQLAGMPVEIAQPLPAHRGIAERAFLPNETQELIEMSQDILRGGAQRVSGKALGTLEVEIATQKEARRILGESVPEVIGTTERGFVQEFAGVPLAKPSRIKKQIEAITTKYTATQKAASQYRFEELWAEKAASFLEQGMSNKEMVTHLDLHRGNILRRGTRMKVIDWGVAATGGSITRSERELFLRAQRTSSEMRIQEIMQKAARDSMLRKQQAAALARRAQQVARDSATPIMGIGSDTPVMGIGSNTPLARPAPPPAASPIKSSSSISWVRQLQKNDLQSQATGIGFKMNAARKGSTKM